MCLPICPTKKAPYFRFFRTKHIWHFTQAHIHRNSNTGRRGHLKVIRCTRHMTIVQAKIIRCIFIRIARLAHIYIYMCISQSQNQGNLLMLVGPSSLGPGRDNQEDERPPTGWASIQ